MPQINLEQLPHQEDAIKAVLQAMEGCRDFDETTNPDYRYVYANPLIQLKPESLNKIKLPESADNAKNIDVKMETGTGKTYVYTRLMYELYKQYGLNKFIIFVPSLAIKEGTKNFILADYARQHFSTLYENMRIDLNIINAGSFNTKKGRKTLPGELIDYLEGSRNQQNTIKCLLINDAMLTSKSMTRDDYDQTLINSVSCPVEAIKATRPVVIIDEPHRFKKDGKAYQAIQNLNPQLIIRFGATFPEIEIVKGRNKTTQKDYENLVYNLGSVQAFNDGLVKAVDIHYPNVEGEPTKYKVDKVLKRDKKVILKKFGTNHEFEIKLGDNLPEDFDGIELGLNLNNDLAINEMKLEEGQILLPSVFAMDYQDLLLSGAIDKHFEKEKENWFRETAGINPPKVKTLSLFFIDSIKSYREDEGWLKVKFEELLQKKLKNLIENETDQEYNEFLQATLDNLSESHAGYFAEDKGKGDEAIQSEVDDILTNKEEMLSFRRKDGSWNVRRFLFSKWTLREGWDNPNVFVITKLRTSGSEISKLQEVGRGLRLPVDENGKRLSTEEFRLDYIIDWSEKDFAEKLVGEINHDANIVLDREKLTDETKLRLLELYGDQFNNDEIKLLTHLDRDLGIIDRADNFKKAVEIDGETKDGYDWLVHFYPELLQSGLQKGKVTNNNKGQRPKVTLRKDNWEQIRNLWEKVTKRYVLQFEKLDDKDFEALLESSVADENVWTNASGQVVSITFEFNSETNQMERKEQTRQIDNPMNILKYGEFLKRLSKRTNITPQKWHGAICERFASKTADKHPKPDKFNTQTLENIIANYQKKFIEVFAQKYSYSALDFSANTSVIKNGEFVDSLEQGMVGVNIATDVQIAGNYLYDEAAYDSEIEHEVLKINPGDKVLAFGKIPRRAIKVPTYTGGTTSPDFVYAIKGDDGKVKLNLLVETKANDMRGGEVIATSAQKKLFADIQGVGWKLATKPGAVSNVLESLT